MVDADIHHLHPGPGLASQDIDAGAALGMLLLEAGLRIYREMATFEEAGVSEKEE